MVYRRVRRCPRCGQGTISEFIRWNVSYKLPFHLSLNSNFPFLPSPFSMLIRWWCKCQAICFSAGKKPISTRISRLATFAYCNQLQYLSFQHFIPDGRFICACMYSKCTIKNKCFSFYRVRNPWKSSAILDYGSCRTYITVYCMWLSSCKNIC